MLYPIGSVLGGVSLGKLQDKSNTVFFFLFVCLFFIIIKSELGPIFLNRLLFMLHKYPSLDIKNSCIPHLNFIDAIVLTLEAK